METLRVLVVDDEAGMRLAVSRALRDCRLELPEAGECVALEVETAESGEQALERIRERAPDLLLLDHKMPGISGLDVLDALAPLKLDMLAVMITAYATIETAVLATRRGAYDFLAKPFTPDELRSALRKTADHLMLARRARALAARRREVRFEFVRVLGHELKAPLAAVASGLDIVSTRALGADLPAYDEVIRRSRVRLDGMNRLIRDLLDLTRIESGHKERRLEPLDVAAVARAALDTQAEPAAARGITLALSCEGAVPLHGDRGELEMILGNLVSNAVKYNRDGGRVDVTVRAEPGAVTVAVTDTGIGLSAENVRRLFGEFVRVRSSETAHIDGSGLGLSIVRKLAELHGGGVSVTSEPGVGSTFTVRLEAPGVPAGETVA